MSNPRLPTPHSPRPTPHSPLPTLHSPISNLQSPLSTLHSPLSTLVPLLDSTTALFVVQYPDYFGQIPDLGGLAEAVHAAGALLCVVANPTALGLLRPPGAHGADIVVGEAQPLGIPLSFGGPYCGFFATRNAYVRKMAGRLVGETLDRKGQRGFVLTLTPREQHIRRGKATSNICTNSGLMMLAATLYLSALGKCGLRQVAELCYQKAHYAAELIGQLEGYQIVGALFPASLPTLTLTPHSNSNSPL
ncbi:MAG: hypothetical protein HY784_08990 [Chloroflexi bacterium]|nr:hypothetical protein [Chloroflexota bacterium]